MLYNTEEFVSVFVPLKAFVEGFKLLLKVFVTPFALNFKLSRY